MYKFLCQNCLFVVENDDWDYYHVQDGHCPRCGGDMCGCSSCLRHIDSCQACQKQDCSNCENLNPCIFDKSIFDELKIYEPEKAFNNAIKKGLKNPENWMYMYSTRFKDYFKNCVTRNYISYFNFSNIFK